MGGVDLFDKLISTFQISHPYHHKWYMSICHYLMEMAMVNAYLLYRKSMRIQNERPLKHHQFRLNIIKNLTKPSYQLKEKYDNLFYYDDDKEEYILTLKRKYHKKPDSCELEKMQSQKLCINCFLHRNAPLRRYTKYWCAACETPLCPAKCYDFHRKERFMEEDDDN